MTETGTLARRIARDNLLEVQSAMPKNVSETLLHCGVPKCSWKVVLPDDEDDWPDCYIKIKSHYLDVHGIDPKVSSSEQPSEVKLSIN